LKKTVLLLGVLPFFAFATEPLKSTVSYTGVNSNNIVFVNFSDPIPEPGCKNHQLWINPNSSEKDKVLSIAMTAFISSSQIVVKTNGCFKGHPTFVPSETDWGWIHLAK